MLFFLLLFLAFGMIPQRPEQCVRKSDIQMQLGTGHWTSHDLIELSGSLARALYSLQETTGNSTKVQFNKLYHGHMNVIVLSQVDVRCIRTEHE
jgi:hypothetical protein